MLIQSLLSGKSFGTQTTRIVPLQVFLDHPLSKSLIHNICSQTSWPLCVFEHGASIEFSVWNFSHIDHKCMARCDLKMLVCANLFQQTLHTIWSLSSMFSHVYFQGFLFCKSSFTQITSPRFNTSVFEYVALDYLLLKTLNHTNDSQRVFPLCVFFYEWPGYL